MGRTASRTATTVGGSAVQAGTDLSRFISAAGLEHLRELLPKLQGEISEIRLDIYALAEESRGRDDARTPLFERVASIEKREQEISAFLNVALTIEEATEYKQLADDHIWLGCMVSYIDEFGPGHVALMGNWDTSIRSGVVELCKRIHGEGDPLCDDFAMASCSTALTQAMIGRKVGDIVEFISDSGRALHLEILAVTPMLHR